MRFQANDQVPRPLKRKMTALKVVIVGGGIGGVTAAQQLEGFADVTLIDRCGDYSLLRRAYRVKN